MSDSNGKSEQVRAILNVIMAEANLTTIGFARHLKGVFGASTVDRLINTEQELSSFQIHKLLEAGGRIAGIPSVRLDLALRGPFSPALLPEFELPFATCKSAGNEEVSDLMAAVASAELSCQEIVVYRPTLPLSLLEEEVSITVIDYLATRYARDPRLAKCRLGDVISMRHEALMSQAKPVGRKFVVVTLMSGLIRMANIDSPFTGCSKDQIAASFGSLLHDHVLGRNLSLVVLNDLVNPLVRTWMAKYENFRSVSLFDSRLLVKRRQKTLNCRIFRAEDSAAAREIIAFHRLDLLKGIGLACHGLKQLEIAEFLVKFMRAAGYGSFGKFGSN